MSKFLDFATPLARLLLVTLAVLVLSLPDTAHQGRLRGWPAGRWRRSRTISTDDGYARLDG